ncbi:hypothetical protein BD324DRAFT_630059 [Kockovaella imperatae]|uniref:Uncharacterized protein n=1 Tax=Kockovaella imperatae TaxID=4999 RepID=A0A1Y1UDG7_9TREE|nr:hypothetical protein BD324DRAFT_630059 [Kockovaella imperatae]ORX36073.1 hypothetical protein BD324DRAFT_630059 [Kockovaella imperatae]
MRIYPSTALSLHVFCLRHEVGRWLVSLLCIVLQLGHLDFIRLKSRRPLEHPVVDLDPITIV